jgi:uncharacterized phage-associated protein
MTIAMTQSSTLAIANFFIRKSIKVKRPISQIKLQKLIYFAHGFYLAVKEKPLVNEKIEAWQYGPVVPLIYHRFKAWGNKPINQVLVQKSDNLYISEEVIEFLDLVWHKFSYYSAGELVDLSHEKDGPWHRAIEKSKALVGFVVPNIVINNIEIFHDFREKYVKNSVDRQFHMSEA